MGKRVVEEAGRALRRARRSRGLTLGDVDTLSAGTFRPTTVAAYERGERSISLQRFCELAELYDLDPPRLFADALRAVRGLPPTVIDLTGIARVPTAERRIVEGFVGQVRRLRNEDSSEVVTLRGGDLEVLATASGHRPQEFLEMLRHALRS